MAKAHPVRLRYTLRALLIFITLFALWGGYHTNRGMKERQAAALIAARGGSCSSHLKKPKGVIEGIAYAYSRLVQVVWREPFTTHVNINSKLEPEVVSALWDFSHLESLGVQPMKYSLPQLSRMNHEGEYHGILEPKFPMPEGTLSTLLRNHTLENLDLSGWILTDADCHAVANHRTLKWLSLYGCDVSEVGFAAIVALPHLKSLNFSCTKVQGDKLSSVPGSASVEQIDASATGVGPEFAKYIARCPNLQSLTLADRTVDDEFVILFGPHPSLRGIELFGGGITDAAIEPLSELPSIERVVLPRGVVSDRAIARLRQAKPGILISQ